MPTAMSTSRCRSTRTSTSAASARVRGYETSAIGPKDFQGDALGGRTMVVANAEYYFPMPGLEKDKSVRLSVFVDAGLVSARLHRCRP